jgi:uncharacterized protein with LGFP repeats
VGSTWWLDDIGTCSNQHGQGIWNDAWMNVCERSHSTARTARISSNRPRTAVHFRILNSSLQEIGNAMKTVTWLYSKTDGQPKKINAVIEWYLQNLVRYQQDDLVELLLLAEYAANNHASGMTKC